MFCYGNFQLMQIIIKTNYCFCFHSISLLFYFSNNKYGIILYI